MRYLALIAAVLLPSATCLSAETVLQATDDASLRAALGKAGPGTRIAIAAGRYRPGVYVSNLQGTAEEPIVIEGADPDDPPRFEGGSEAWHLSDCAHLVLRNLAVSGQSGNGLNIDDGGSFDTPAHHVTLQGIHVTRVGPRGNHDGIKLSGLDDFTLRDCTIEGWGGSAIDMVGCHRGLIEGCTFRGLEGCSNTTGPQCKGGSSQITIRRSTFIDGGDRAVNLGGSTGTPYFRPQRAKYEAKEITVEGCTFTGSIAPVAFVGVDGATFRYNTLYRPGKWVMRILQETTAPGFPPCRNGVFERNLIVFRRADVRVFVNVGPNTAPGTFRFADNLWYCEDRPEASRPRLPAAETDGVYGLDPRLAAPEKGDFTPRAEKAKDYGAGALPSESKSLPRGR